MSNHDHAYIDCCDLASLSLMGSAMLIFAGASGSGKSSAIEHVINTRRHEYEFSCLDVTQLQRPEAIEQYCVPGDRRFVVVDEIWTIAQLLALRRLTQAGYRFVLASHLNPLLTRVLTLGVGRVVDMDAVTHKLPAYLEHRGISWSRDVLRQYRRRYGNVFTEMQIILEQHPGECFDTAFRSFHKYNVIEKDDYPWASNRPR